MFHFEIYIGVDRLFHWRFVSSNGRNICWSEGYSSKQNALESIRIVQNNSDSSDIEDQTK